MLAIAATLGALLALGLLPITALGLAIATRAGGHLPATIAASLGLSVGGTSWHLLRRLAIPTSGLAVTARLLTITTARLL